MYIYYYNCSNGTYFFSATMSAAPHTGYYVKFIKNSLTEEIGYLLCSANHSYVEHSTSFLVQLVAGDTVKMACTSSVVSHIAGASNGKQHEYHSHFSGFRIND